MSGGEPMRIGLFGQFGIGNLGNEGSLEAMLRFLRERAPQAEIVCICTDPDFVRATYGIEAVRLQVDGVAGGFSRLLNRVLFGMPARFANVMHTFKQAGRLDLLLIPGTGILDDFGERPTGAPYEIWRWCQAAKWSGARIAFVSIGAGPIINPLSRALMKSAARCAAYRSYRDLPSKAFVNSIAMRTPQDPVFPDLAFGLPAPPRPARGEGPLVVAVGVMAYFGWAGEDGDAVYDRYLRRLSEYVVWLLKAGHRVRFVIGKDKDADAVADLQRRLGVLAHDLTDGIEPFEPARNLADVMRQMASADIAVVTRFHNLVCALHVGTPCVSLGYAEKNHALLEEMGLGRFSQEVETFDLEILKRHTEKLIAERAQHAAFISRKVVDYGLQLKAQERLLTEEFLAPKRSVGMAAPARVNAKALEHPVAH